MALAQGHSKYQAAIHTSTHQHSDGRDPPDIGVVENVAGGDLGYLDPQAAVYEIWADPVHQRTMLGFVTPIPLVTLVPATPRPDGSIVHTVGYGQTLWAIALAYGIQVDQIRAWNNLAAGSTDIYAGQRLLVRPANLVMASPTLPAGPGAQPAGGVTATPAVHTVESAVTPSPQAARQRSLASPWRALRR